MRGEFFYNPFDWEEDDNSVAGDQVETGMDGPEYPEHVIAFSDLVYDRYGVDSALAVLDEYDAKGEKYIDELIACAIEEFRLTIPSDLSAIQC